jgi:hypothetical protein
VGPFVDAILLGIDDFQQPRRGFADLFLPLGPYSDFAVNLDTDQRQRGEQQQ